LSGGQQQRIGLARAMAMNPPLFLMDEPFGALDPLLRARLQEEFCRIKKELGSTIVFVTHDINEAFRLGDRIAIMDGAELVQVGTPEELIFSPASDLVAEIVDAKRKYRHMDALKVKDMIQPLDSRYILDSRLSTSSALDQMTREGLEVALVFEDQKRVWRVNLTELLRSLPEGKSLKETLTPLPIFSPETPLLQALAELKAKEELIGLVLENNEPLGLLFSERVLQNLI
jgi:osmoprotectant transport system ATP-binding protein